MESTRRIVEIIKQTRYAPKIRKQNIIDFERIGTVLFTDDSTTPVETLQPNQPDHNGEVFTEINTNSKQYELRSHYLRPIMNSKRAADRPGLLTGAAGIKKRKLQESRAVIVDVKDNSTTSVKTLQPYQHDPIRDDNTEITTNTKNRILRSHIVWQTMKSKPAAEGPGLPTDDPTTSVEILQPDQHDPIGDDIKEINTNIRTNGLRSYVVRPKIKSKQAAQGLYLPKTSRRSGRTLQREHYLIEKDIQEMHKNLEQLGRQSHSVVASCKIISEHLRKSLKDIVNVWPSYTLHDQSSITFVIITKENCATTKETLPGPLKQLNVLFRSVKSYSDEEKDAKHHILKTNSKISKRDSELLRRITEKKSEMHMTRHKNLNILSVSPIKSQNYGNKVQKVLYTNEPCVVLFVHVKGYIPIAEDAFPKYINRFKTDVREGAFELYRPGNVTTGSAIGAKRVKRNIISIGTLGPFLEVPGESTVFSLTSAHVVYTNNELNDLVSCKVKTEKSEGLKVYVDPRSPTTKRYLGHVRKAVYREGEDNGEAGCEAALIEINDPSSITAGFPGDINEDYLSGSRFTSGMFYEQVKDIPQHCVAYKYGDATKFTKGSFSINGASVRTDTLNYSTFGFCLRNQIEMQHIGNGSFATFGDSGALVLVPHNSNNDDLRAVGIISGGTVDGSSVFVSPICDILQAFGLSKVKRLKTFSQEVAMDVDDSEDITDSTFKKEVMNQFKIIKDHQGKMQENLKKLNERVFGPDTTPDIANSKKRKLKRKMF